MVDLFGFRSENNIHPGLGGQLHICLELARVVRVVRGVVELQFIDEHGNNYNFILFTGCLEQGTMAAVQGTHGGHKAQ